MAKKQDIDDVDNLSVAVVINEDLKKQDKDDMDVLSVAAMKNEDFNKNDMDDMDILSVAAMKNEDAGRYSIQQQQRDRQIPPRRLRKSSASSSQEERMAMKTSSIKLSSPQQPKSYTQRNLQRESSSSTVRVSQQPKSSTQRNLQRESSNSTVRVSQQPKSSTQRNLQREGSSSTVRAPQLPESSTPRKHQGKLTKSTVRDPQLPESSSHKGHQIQHSLQGPDIQKRDLSRSEGYGGTQYHVQHHVEATDTRQGSFYVDAPRSPGSAQGYWDASSELQQYNKNSRNSEFRQSVMFEAPQTLQDSALRVGRRCMTILSVTLCLLVLSLLVACAGFALEVIRLKSLMSSVNNALSTQQAELVNQSFSSRVERLQASSGSFHQNLNQRVTMIETDFFKALDGRSHRLPLSSCASLSPSAPSGYYWIRTPNGSVTLVYCTITDTCGDTTRSWMRLLGLDMANSSHQCPQNLRESNAGDIRVCVKSVSRYCSHVMLSTLNISYTEVCGRIIGYQYGNPNAIIGTNIEVTYIDGVSLTHGRPRNHIWSFAAVIDEIRARPSGYCICILRQRGIFFFNIKPSFLNGDYFCDTGTERRSPTWKWYTDDPLWDGAGCGEFSTCCSQRNPPWFYKVLPQPTTDDIEMRVCMGEYNYEEDVGLAKIDIYVR